jgi:S1-C subfamily serine protease
MRGSALRFNAAVKKTLSIALVFSLSAGSALAAPLPSRRNEIVEVVEKVAPSVVNIAAEQIVRRRPSVFDDFFFGFEPRARKAQSLGSGVIIDPKGIILTNDHVISGASKIVATTKSGLELECEVVGSDTDNDLAVLRVKRPGAPLPSIRLGASGDLMIGETVVAIGNPFGLSNTVTAGVLSALGRSVRGNENQRVYTDFIQIDAPINPGNSGGPVVNIQGDLIGIATAIIGGAQGIGFAIPVDRARRIKDDILNFGEVRAVWVGLRGRTLTSGEGEEAKARGFRVRAIAPDSPADRAGVQPGDQVVSVDGAPIDSKEAWDTALSTRGPGKPMKVVLRGAAGERAVTLSGQEPPAGVGLRILREQLGITLRQGRGTLVLSVAERGSAAANAGLQTGDSLLALNNTPVKTSEDVDRVLKRDYNRSTLWMEVGRGSFAYNLSFPLD